MADPDMKQACLDLSSAALALFDELEEKGVTAPMEDYVALSKLKSIIDKAEEMRYYYGRRSAQRLLALGVKPADLLKMHGYGG